MRKFSSIMVSLALLGLIASCGNGATAGIEEPVQDMSQQAPDMMQPMPDSVLVTMDAVREWYKPGGDGSLCMAPEELRYIFELYCDSQGYELFREGESDTACTGGIIENLPSFKNLICFKIKQPTSPPQT